MEFLDLVTVLRVNRFTMLLGDYLLDTSLSPERFTQGAIGSNHSPQSEISSPTSSGSVLGGGGNWTRDARSTRDPNVALEIIPANANANRKDRKSDGSDLEHLRLKGGARLDVPARRRHR